MLDHDALSFSLVPFCYGVCPFVNQLHPLPSATSGIPVNTTIDTLQHQEPPSSPKLLDFKDFLQHRYFKASIALRVSVTFFYSLFRMISPTMLSSFAIT
jgi:hypothetical protein